MLSKISALVKRYNGQTKRMYFFIETDDLSKNYNTIWHKVSADFKKESNSDPVYNKNFLKTKIKSHSDGGTDFYDNETPKVIKLV